jgi:hypothetical protein
MSLVVSDSPQKREFSLSTRFVLDSPVSRRQHAAANGMSATIS